uniref:Immunoglobulin domain-containing protein n=1 Tax=Astyanax mexicanus TaxID=7994 RepID=A0A8B9KQE7_ASTMX
NWLTYNICICFFFLVLTHVATKDKPKDTYVGIEGSTLEINCEYADGYQDYIKYFCRNLCKYDDILIKSESSNTLVSKGRYTGLDNVSQQKFTVTIRNLVLEDSGEYYCGVERSGRDLLNKVKLFISGAVLLELILYVLSLTNIIVMLVVVHNWQDPILYVRSLEVHFYIVSIVNTIGCRNVNMFAGLGYPMNFHA